MRLTKNDPTGNYAYFTDGLSPASSVLSDNYTTFTPGISEMNALGTRFYLADASGNSRGLLNSGQAATDGYNWDAFGTLISRFGSNPTMFAWNEASGYQTDSDDGLTLLGHRYYDKRTGRFISQDPAGSGDNWYAYVSNDPMNAADPSGLYVPDPEPLTDQTMAHNEFASAFYGDHEGLDNFFKKQDQQTQQGEDRYAAGQEVIHAFIDPKFSTSQREAIENSLALIASTSRGAEIMAAAYRGDNYISVANTVFSTDRDVFVQPGITFVVGEGNIGVNPAVLPYYQVENTDGWDTPSILQVVAHELGHGLTGIRDSGPGSNDNVYANENPILSGLGQPTRLSYGGVRALPNPYGL